MIPKRFVFFALCLLLFSACSTDDGYRDKNPNLIDLRFTHQLDLDLPRYNNLKFPGNSFTTYSYGINGIVIYNINNSLYTAFELSDPNHPLTDCSTLRLNGTEVICECDDGNVYTIITGQQTSGQGEYALKSYRIKRIGNVLEISN